EQGLHLLAQLGPVGEASEAVIVGEAADAGGGFVALEGDRAKVDAGTDDVFVPDARPALLPVVEGEGAADTAVAHGDRARPARDETEWQRQGLVVVPQRVGCDVVDDDGFSPPSR